MHACRWREIQKLAEKKPVVASMGDVAGSGVQARPRASPVNYHILICQALCTMKQDIDEHHAL